MAPKLVPTTDEAAVEQGLVRAFKHVVKHSTESDCPHRLQRFDHGGDTVGDLTVRSSAHDATTFRFVVDADRVQLPRGPCP